MSATQNMPNGTDRADNGDERRAMQTQRGENRLGLCQPPSMTSPISTIRVPQIAKVIASGNKLLFGLDDDVGTSSTTSQPP